MCLKVTGSDYLLIWRRMCSQEVGYLMFMGMCPNDSGIGGLGRLATLSSRPTGGGCVFTGRIKHIPLVILSCG